MYSRTLILFYLVAILLGCTAAQTVQLQVFEASSVWWIAVLPKNDGAKTTKVEIQDSAMKSFSTMTYTQGWGYYSFSSVSGSGLSSPITFRLTTTAGQQISVQVSGVLPGSSIDTGAQYGGSVPSTAPSTPKPTFAPTTAPTRTPTTTTAPTRAPTTAPTRAPTTAPTRAPTTAPTRAPTTAPTRAPTTAPTRTPTTAPTRTPTIPSTAAPTTLAPTRTPSIPSSDLCAITSTSYEPLKLLVPLYVYPGAAWDQLIQAASKVKIIAIINPNSGPLATVDSAYSSYMTKLKNAGIEMVGYVYSSYGTRSINDVKTDITTYATKYPLVTGIFIDEAAADAKSIPYYTQVYQAIMANSKYVHTILNPGTQPDQGYLAISTNLMIYEDYGTALTARTYPDWVKCASSAAQKAGYKYRFSGIAHTATSSQSAGYLAAMQNKGIGLVYVTDGAGGCCTYNSLVSYFAAEATSLQSLNSA